MTNSVLQFGCADAHQEALFSHGSSTEKALKIWHFVHTTRSNNTEVLDYLGYNPN